MFLIWSGLAPYPCMERPMHGTRFCNTNPPCGHAHELELQSQQEYIFSPQGSVSTGADIQETLVPAS